MMTEERMVETVASNQVLSKDQILLFCTVMERLHRLISNQYGVAFYVKVSDSILEQIRKNPDLPKDPKYMQHLITSSGDNVFIFGLYTTKQNEGRFQSIRTGLTEIIEREKPKSVSWFNRRMTKLFYRRTECHQS